MLLLDRISPVNLRMEGNIARKPYFLMVQPMVALRFPLEFSILDP